jgi:hypothetical protein
MRFFEFAGDGIGDKFIVVLRNYIGRAASMKAPSNLNWNGLQQVLKASGVEVAADYETFKAMYDSSPQLQSMVSNFNDKGVELKVPGAPDDRKSDGTKDSEEEIAKIAASAAPQQLQQQQAGVQA